MSIASEITRLQTSKADIKTQVNIDVDDINEGTDFIDEETLDDYADLIENMQDAYKQYIPINSTSDTQIEASKEGAIIGKTIKGNTTQDGTPTPSSPVSVNNVAGEQVVRVCRKNLFDVSSLVGKTYNGTSSTTRVCNSQAIYLTPGTYAFSTNIDTSVYEFKSDVLKEPPTTPITETYIHNSGFGTSTSRIITIASAGYFAILIRDKNSANLDLTTLKNFEYQLEKSSSATSYEEYQGKDYEINLGKNLIEPIMASETLNGVTCTNNGDGSFTLNGTATANTTFRIDQSTSNGHDNLKNYNGTYTFSCDQLQADMDLILMQINTWLVVLRMNGSNTPVTANVNKDDCFIYVQVRNGKSLNNLTIKPMLEKSSVATSYSPYFTPIELNKIGNYQDFIRKGTGKNLADTNEMYLGYTLNTDGNLLGGNDKRCTMFQIAVKPSTKYSLSVASNYQIGNIFYYKEDKTFLSMSSSAWGNNKAITTPSGAYYISFATRVSTDATMVESDLTNLHIQIEENSSVTYYEPFGYKDKWYIEKNVGIATITGNEVGWNKSNNSFQLQSNDYDIGKVPSVNQGAFSRNYKFEYWASGITSNLTNYCFGWNANKHFTIRNDTYSTAEDFKTYLRSNNQTFLIPLVTPIYTLIENEELLSQLDRIMQLYEGQNNILVTGDLAATLDLNYIAKAENHL